MKIYQHRKTHVCGFVLVAETMEVRHTQCGPRTEFRIPGPNRVGPQGGVYHTPCGYRGAELRPPGGEKVLLCLSRRALGASPISRTLINSHQKKLPLGA